MGLIVQKYGGSSLATPEHIRNVARSVAAARAQGNQVAVVVSAMAGETDRLLNLARELSPLPPEREQDVLVSTGEQVSAALLAMALNGLGCPARSYLGFQLPLRTDSSHTKARILSVGGEKLEHTLRQGIIAIVAGFQGVTEAGDITTLGRGGSDTTAVALAAALRADVCEIYTDVDGVYTTDPHICPKARHLEKIAYEEMLEMASLGAKVLQIRAVELAWKYRVPLLVKSSFGSNRCTWIVEEEKIEMENAIVSGITLDRNQAKISVIGVPDRPGIAYRIISPLAQEAINVDMIIQNASSEGFTDFTFTVPRGDEHKARPLMEQIAREIGAREVRIDNGIAKVSVVGIGMKNHPGVASRMFKALAEHNINIEMISTSEIRISCVVNAHYGELAVRVLHDAFELDRSPQK
ncbi:MAG: aspartate kinase [Dethiobacteria bacterium]|jgi:aspartate kinase|nr:aspartate kinase [Bacillota bacterium]HOP69550.1 aspartate kinase [Bacillota bacterium]HPT34483.1 aspartate kinase [Bacillota bacterium]HQD06680.1 aspartate kinase [Bacillota bacterium]